MSKDMHEFTMEHTGDLDAYFAEMMKDSSYREVYNEEKTKWQVQWRCSKRARKLVCPNRSWRTSPVFLRQQSFVLKMVTTLPSIR